MNRKNINRKTVSFSRTEQVHVIKPCDLNGGVVYLAEHYFLCLMKLQELLQSAIPAAIM